MVQQLQKQLAEARRLAQSDRGASGAAKVPGVPQGSDAAAWKETCARLQAQLAEKDELIQMLQVQGPHR